jgi:hypothetical protein
MVTKDWVPNLPPKSHQPCLSRLSNDSHFP